MLRAHDFIVLMPEHVPTLDLENGLLTRIDWDVPFGAGSVGVSHRGAEREQSSPKSNVKKELELHGVIWNMQL